MAEFQFGRTRVEAHPRESIPKVDLIFRRTLVIDESSSFGSDGEAPKRANKAPILWIVGIVGAVVLGLLIIFGISLNNKAERGVKAAETVSGIARPGGVVEITY